MANQSIISQVKKEFAEVYGIKATKANVLQEMPFPDLLTANFNSVETWKVISEYLEFFDTVQLSHEPEQWQGEVQQKVKNEQDNKQFDNAVKVHREHVLNVTSNKPVPSVTTRLKRALNITININGKTFNGKNLEMPLTDFYGLLTDFYAELLEVTKGNIPLRLVDSLPLPSLDSVYSIEIKTKGYKVKNGKASGFYKANGKIIAPERVHGVEENEQYLQKRKDTIYCKDLWDASFDPKKDLLSIKVNGKFYLLELRRITPSKQHKNSVDTLDKLVTVKAKQFHANLTEDYEKHSKAILVTVPQSNFFYRYVNPNNGMLPLTLSVTNKGNVFVELPYGYSKPISIGTIINNKVTVKRWKDTQNKVSIANHLNNKDMQGAKLALKIAYRSDGKLIIKDNKAYHHGMVVATCDNVETNNFIPTIQFLNEIAIQSGLQSYDLNFLKCDHIRQQIMTLVNKLNHKMICTQSYNKAKIKDIKRMLTKICAEFVPDITLGKTVNTMIRVMSDQCNGDLKEVIYHLMPVLNYVKGKTTDNAPFEQFKQACKLWLS